MSRRKRKAQKARAVAPAPTGLPAFARKINPDGTPRHKAQPKAEFAVIPTRVQRYARCRVCRGEYSIKSGRTVMPRHRTKRSSGWCPGTGRTPALVWDKRVPTGRADSDRPKTRIPPRVSTKPSYYGWFWSEDSEGLASAGLPTLGKRR